MSILVAPLGLFGLGMVFCFLVASLFLITPFKKQGHKTGSSLVAFLMLTMMGGSFFLYDRYGSLESVQDKAIIMKISHSLAALQNYESISRFQVLTILKDIEKQLPKRDVPWGYLANVYQHLGLLEQAATTYHHAFELNSGAQSYLIQEAYLLSTLGQGKLPATLKTHLENTLKQDIKNKEILTLLAMDAHQHEAYKCAIAYWQRLLEQSHSLSAEELSYISLMLTKARKGII